VFQGVEKLKEMSDTSENDFDWRSEEKLVQKLSATKNTDKLI